MLQNRVIYIVAILILTLFSCNQNKNNTKTTVNKYCNSRNLQYISLLYQQKNVVTLTKLLSQNTSADDLAEILYSLSIINDTSNASVYLPYLLHNDPNVRLAAAYAIGQSQNTQLEKKLFSAYNNETDNSVKAAILIAIAKCSTTLGAEFIANTKINSKNQDLQSAQGLAFFYLALKNLLSSQIINKIIQVIDDANTDEDLKIAYSSVFMLNLNSNVDLSGNFAIFRNGIKGASNVYLAINLANALKFIPTSDNLAFISQILDSDMDYRIKIAAIDALKIFSYSSAKKIALKGLNDDNSSVAEQAAEYFLANGTASDAQLYFDFSKKIVFWQPRTTMLWAALKYSSNKNQIANTIISGYNAVDNIYEKASLLSALSADPNQYKFVKEQTFNTDSYIISSAGIATLYNMRLNPDFNKIAAQNPSIITEFNIIFKEAASSQNSTLIYYAAKIFNHSNLNIIDLNSNTYFLNQALSNLRLPADFDAFTELCNAINNFGTQNCNTNPQIGTYTVDWNKVCSISTDQKVIVKTSKGVFELALFVDKAPATVELFLEMVSKKYYKNTFFYKLIPATAIVCGGSRGDGYSAVNISLLREHNNVKFQEGCIAMKTLNNKYQSINWFITLAPTPQYDDDYTVFGKVTKGLEVVHKLEVGDKILEISLK